MSTLAEELERYVAIRRSLGYELVEAARILKRFVAFADAQGADHITTDLFLRWKDGLGTAGTGTWAERLAVVRLFAQWLKGIDPITEVPPKSLIPRSLYRRTRPYIYTEQEIASIIAEAARLPSLCGIRSLTYTILFGPIAVTGLRVSEAIALDDQDVDVAGSVLTIRRGKFGKARIVPIAKSTTDRLIAYAKDRDRLLGHTPKPFFVTDHGTRPKKCSAQYSFAMVCQRIGLRPAQKFNRHGRGPRLHDLRHTFAVRTMLDWYRTGKDPEREMIKLSTYLGHSEPEHTYWYIEAIPELLKLASQRAERSLAWEDGR
jgi:integrase/recombinase XerD